MKLVRPLVLLGMVAGLLLFSVASPGLAQEVAPPVVAPEPPKMASAEDLTTAKNAALQSADIAWILVASALVMVMLPGLALFYGGMVRRKNVLGTMMHTMAALGIVGVQWVVCGYSLSFGESAISVTIGHTEAGEPIKGSLIGYSPELIGLGSSAAVGTDDKAELKAMGKDPEKATDEEKAEAAKTVAHKNRFKTFPNTQLPVYLHAMFQGMFAIITVALISGAFAERVKFGSYCLFILIWTTVVYDPLAHWVWSYNWVKAKPDDPAMTALGWLGVKGAIDFAGGTVVHIAAGVSGLAAILVLRKRTGYLKQTFHPNSMVFTLLGAGLLWFGWFGFNGGSALFANAQAVSAFTVTQVAAAMASLSWMGVEWIHRGKPTALGFASGLVAGLVAITPASGFVTPGGALIIGALSGIVCYWAVTLKTVLGYDDSLDAFGIHGVGGILGAVLTGALVSLPLWLYGTQMPVGTFPGKLNADSTGVDFAAQLQSQFLAVGAAALYGFLVTGILVALIEYTIGFTVKLEAEAEGLDLSQHNETGMDVGPDVDAGAVVTMPKAASAPPSMTNGHSKRFTVVIEGVAAKDLHKAWEELCKPKEEGPSKEFAAIYPYLTTVKGNLFRFRGGDPVVMKEKLKSLFEASLDTTVQTHVEH